jgi:molecular chaperone HscA
MSRVAIGIDLGTTYSCVGVFQNGNVEIIANDQGNRTTPSYVCFQAEERLIGDAAKNASNQHPEHTIYEIKRMIGRDFNDPILQRDLKLLTYKIVNEKNRPKVEINVNDTTKTYSPEEISAMILTKMKTIAESFIGKTVTDCVITTPAYFNDAQRQSTKDAGLIAGMNVLRVINEPTAAAIAYGLDNGSEGVYAVYDLGGGTFDISILRLSKGVFEVLATGGDSALGGDDFDHRLFCWVIEQANLAPLSDEDTRLLMVKSREAKEILSSHAETHIDATLSSGEEVRLTITATEFANLTQHLIGKTLAPCRRAVRDAGLNVDDIDGVVLVGGATRMPQVRKAVADYFKTLPLANIDPDKVVALGAAIQANLLAGNRAAGDDWLLLDVIPLSLGIETMGGLVEKVIPRNSTIPCARAQEFTTFKDGQTAMAVHVVQGERELVSDCRSLARFELRGIPPMAAGAARIRVTYQVDADGLLSVSARELHSGVEASIEVKPSYGLGDDEIARMLQDSFSSAEQDMQLRALREEQVEAERILIATQSALDQDADLLSAEERSMIDALMAQVRSTAQGSKHSIINDAVEALAKATEEFAARRMDRSVRSVLAGRKLDEIA